MNKRNNGWAVAAVLAVGLIAVIVYSYMRSNNTPVKQPKTDSGTSITIGSPILSQPRYTVHCQGIGDTCTMLIVADSTSFPSEGQPMDVVFTPKYDIPANTKIELRIYQKGAAK